MLHSRSLRRARSSRFAATVAALALTLGAAVAGAGGASAAGSPNAALSIDKRTVTAEIRPNETMVWELEIGCESLETICIDAVLHDLVPADFDVTDVRVIGTTQNSTVTIGTRDPATGTTVDVVFNETSNRFPGIKGIEDGQKISVLVSSRLRADTPLTKDGVKVVNTGEVGASNATTVHDDAEVTLKVPPTTAVDVEKTWSSSSQIADPTATNDLTLTIQNTSNIAASTLTLDDPKGAVVNPFDAVQFTGFGDFALPEGAATVTVTALTAGSSHTAPPSATVSLPAGVAADQVTGFVFTFASASGEQIVPFGAAGKIVLHSQQRSTVSTTAVTTVSNTAFGTVTTAGGGTATDDDTAAFVITPLTAVVSAAKSFSPTSVMAGAGSVVTVRGGNASNTTLGSLTITEPATSPPVNPFSATLDFVGFGPLGNGDNTSGGSWPTGATSASVQFRYSDETTSTATVTALTGWPAPASGKRVIGFTVSYTGTIDKSAEAKIPFLVRTASTASGPVLNRVQVDGAGPGGSAATETAEATITVAQPLIVPTLTKAVSSANNVAGQEVIATLTGTTGSTSNVQVRQFVIEDSVATTASGLTGGQKNFWNVFTASRISSTVVPANSTLTVYTRTDGTTYTAAGAPYSAGTIVELPLASDVTGVRLVYDAIAGLAIPSSTSFVAKVVFTLNAAQAADSLKWTNCAVAKGTGDNSVSGAVSACGMLSLRSGTVPVPVLSQTTSKSWSPAQLLIPNDKVNGSYPSTTLTIATKNNSALNATTMSLQDPTAGTTPFEYLTITKINDIKLSGGTLDAAKTRVRLLKTDGAVVYDVTGSAAISGAKALAASGLVDVADIRVSVEGTFPSSAQLKVTATAQLRKQTRTAGTDITTAAAALTGNSVNNTVTGVVSDGSTTVTKTASRAVTIIPAADSVLQATLSKTVSPTSMTVYSATPDRTVSVRLGIAKKTGNPNSYVVNDTTPTFWNAFDFSGLRSITGLKNASADYTVRVDYLTNRVFSTDAGEVAATAGSWVNGTAFTMPVGTTALTPAQKALPTGVSASQVSGIRISYTAAGGKTWATDTIDGFAGQKTTFEVSPRHYLRTGEPVSDTASTTANPSETVAGRVSNLATATADDGLRAAPVKTNDAPAVFTFVAGHQSIQVDKTPNTSAVVPGEEIPFKLKVTNTGTTPLLTPVFTDSIPWDAKGALLQYNPATYTPASYTVTPAGAAITTDARKISVITTDKAADKKTEIVFTFPAGSSILPGESYTITLPMKVRAGVERNTVFDNSFRLTADGGFSATDIAQVTVLEGGSYGRIKDVQENVATGQSATGLFHTIDKSNSCITDGGFYRVPCLVETKPGGTETWRLRVINTGNLPTTSMTMVDVFPKPADTGTSKALSSLSRGSLWTPIFQGGIVYGAVPAGTQTTLWYQTAADQACVLNGVPDSADPFGTTCADGQWHLSSTTDLSELSDLSVVTAIKLTLDFTAVSLKPGEQVEVRYQTKTPDQLPRGVPAYTADEAPSPAWNSFVVFTTTDKTGGPDYETLEPNKAGIAFATPVAVGDYVWVDADRDGVQDATEQPLAGVKVTLYDSADVEVATTTTDADGRYLFDELWPGDYHAEFELTPAQQARYSFTTPGWGSPVLDSNANSVGVTAVFHLDAADAAYPEVVSRADYQADTGISIRALYIDPTIDAGVIPSAVSVGDYVWLDANEDGIQDSAEAGIDGVVLTLTGPDGRAVTDVYGSTVGPTTTDAVGWYGFADLPVLDAGESYTVHIDYVASTIPLFGLFQSPTGTGTTATDSSRDSSASGDLISDGDSDETLDFGFFEAELPTFPLPPEELETLAVTGAALGTGALVVGGLLTGGLLLVFLSRRTRGRHS